MQCSGEQLGVIMDTEIFKKLWNRKDLAIWLVALRLIIGFEWLFAGIHKVPGFPQAMQFILPGFTVDNPHTWFVNLINNAFIPNAELLGYFVMIGEIVLGAFLILGIFVNFSAIGSIFMNFIFFFAAGHSSASTFSVNWIMIAIGFIFLLSVGSKHLSIDSLIVHKWPKLKRWLVDWFGFEKDLSDKIVAS